MAKEIELKKEMDSQGTLVYRIYVDEVYIQSSYSENSANRLYEKLLTFHRKGEYIPKTLRTDKIKP